MRISGQDIHNLLICGISSILFYAVEVGLTTVRDWPFNPSHVSWASLHAETQICADQKDGQYVYQTTWSEAIAYDVCSFGERRTWLMTVSVTFPERYWWCASLYIRNNDRGPGRGHTCLYLETDRYSSCTPLQVRTSIDDRGDTWSRPCKIGYRLVLHRPASRRSDDVDGGRSRAGFAEAESILWTMVVLRPCLLRSDHCEKTFQLLREKSEGVETHRWHLVALFWCLFQYKYAVKKILTYLFRSTLSLFFGDLYWYVEWRLGYTYCAWDLVTLSKQQYSRVGVTFT